MRQIIDEWFGEVTMRTLYHRIRAYFWTFFIPSTISMSFGREPMSSTFELVQSTAAFSVK